MADKIMVKPEKVDTVVNATVDTKKTKDPCDKCKRTYDKKSLFCKSCVNYKDK